MERPATRRRDTAQLCANLILSNDGEKDAVEDRQVFAAVRRIKDELAETDRVTRSLGRAVKHIDLWVSRIAGDFIGRENNGRMFVAVIGIDPHLHYIPLTMVH